MNLKKEILDAIFYSSNPDFNPADERHLLNVFYRYSNFITVETYCQLMTEFNIPYPPRFKSKGASYAKRKAFENV